MGRRAEGAEIKARSHGSVQKFRMAFDWQWEYRDLTKHFAGLRFQWSEVKQIYRAPTTNMFEGTEMFVNTSCDPTSRRIRARRDERR